MAVNGGETMAEYRAVARREGRWWTIDIPDVGATTQARRISDVEWMARECVSLTLDVSESDVSVVVEYRVPESIHAEWEASRRMAEHAKEEAAESARLARDVVARMRDEGYTYAEMASVLGLSPQRVHQLGKAS